MSKEIKDEPIVDLGGTISKSEKFFIENKKHYQQLLLHYW